MPRKSRKTPWLGKRKDSDGYYVFWYDEDDCKTKRLSLRTTDDDKARHRFAAFLVEGEALFTPRRGDNLTVQRALDDYFKEHVFLKCAAPERQEFAIRNLKAFFGDKELASVDIPASRRYAAARRNGAVGGDKWGNRRAGSDSTIRRELNVLIAASNHAKKWDRISSAPNIELTEGTVTGEDDEAPFYTQNEISRLIETAEGQLKWFIELAYWTGARRRSIEYLTRPQVKWDQKRILLKKPSKKSTNKRQPIVPIFPEMIPPLTALWEQGEEDRLFTMGDVYHPYRRHCEALGFKDRCNPHMLRHSRATHLLQDGKSLYAVSKLLGDTMATVERVYGHHAVNELADEIGGAYIS